MSYQDWLEVFAYIVLVCVVVAGVIDLATELGIAFFINVKWTIFWYVVRYVGVGCAIALAIDVVQR